VTGAAFVILAEFRLKPGRRERFLEVVRADALVSVRDEPGCRRFDLLVPEDDPDTVWLYEVYDSKAAFDAHLETPHFKAFERDSKDLVAGSTVRRLSQIEHAKSLRGAVVLKQPQGR
jgi:(4S)-4-hydroxy-5-phosphonooxypentane-2,3-dione isomerase